MAVYNVRAKHALTRGICGHAPPEKIFFSSSEVDFEPVSANSIVEPRTLEQPLHFCLPIEFPFGGTSIHAVGEDDGQLWDILAWAAVSDNGAIV